jgi:RNA polymerase sigma-70 factor (ECF subfamily)
MSAAVALDPSDRLLSERARSGERVAFDALVARYQDRAYRLAWRMSGSRGDAEDIVQEAFFHAYRAMGTFHGDSAFGTWLYRIVVNEGLMRKRAASRRPTSSLDESSSGCELAIASSDDERAEHLVEQKRVTQEVQRALATLDDDHRTALILRDLEGLSSEEAGKILGVHPATIRQRAHRARVRLRFLLAHLAGAVC